MSRHECSYFRAETSVCLRPVQAVIHFIVVTEHAALRFAERTCKAHYAKIAERIRQAGHEIVEVSDCCR